MRMPRKYEELKDLSEAQILKTLDSGCSDDEEIDPTEDEDCMAPGLDAKSGEEGTEDIVEVSSEIEISTI